MGFKDLQIYQHHFWAVLTPPLTSYSNMMLKGLIIGHWVYVWSYHFSSIRECFNKTTNPKQLCASQHNGFLSTIGFSIWLSAKKRFHDVMQFSVHEVHRKIIKKSQKNVCRKNVWVSLCHGF